MAKIFFRIVVQDGGSYAVEITEPGQAPYSVPGFASEDAAEAWVADRQFASRAADHWERRPDAERRY
jgi:hypothetical protein